MFLKQSAFHHVGETRLQNWATQGWKITLTGSKRKRDWLILGWTVPLQKGAGKFTGVRRRLACVLSCDIWSTCLLILPELMRGSFSRRQRGPWDCTRLKLMENVLSNTSYRTPPSVRAAVEMITLSEVFSILLAMCHHMPPTNCRASAGAMTMSARRRLVRNMKPLYQAASSRRLNLDTIADLSWLFHQKCQLCSSLLGTFYFEMDALSFIWYRRRVPVFRLCSGPVWQQLSWRLTLLGTPRTIILLC